VNIEEDTRMPTVPENMREGMDSNWSQAWTLRTDLACSELRFI